MPTTRRIATAMLSLFLAAVPTHHWAGAQQRSQTHVPVPPPRVRIEIEKRGVLVVELFRAKTPKTTAHFIALVNRHFYDHLLFHSVVKGFLASAGDPKSRSMNGSKLAGLSEFQVAEQYGLGTCTSGSRVPLEPGYNHDRGTIGLQHPRSNIDGGDCIFFLNITDNPENYGAYTSFGKVIFGLNVLDKINQGDRIVSMKMISTDAELDAIRSTTGLLHK
jgi:peptidyl-prolyl cis-trans isomerase B (cyclophilin B)